MERMLEVGVSEERRGGEAQSKDKKRLTWTHTVQRLQSRTDLK